MARSVQLLSLVALSAAKTIRLDHSPYHVMWQGDHVHCFTRRDIHLLTGEICDERGGKLAVHVLNGTMPDYEAQVGPNSTLGPERSLNATIDCKGTPHKIKGNALVLEGQLKNMEYKAMVPSVIAALAMGPNPPPPPPPPPPVPDCATHGGANQSACDAVPPVAGGSPPACSWCISKDGLHAHCFIATMKPDVTEWDCDR